jgi:hypothetical protein
VAQASPPLWQVKCSWQGALTGEPHVPSPLQTPAVKVEPVHVPPHAVVALGYAQALTLVPSHTPVHDVPPSSLPAHGVWDSCGAPVTGAHVPMLPVTSHASH